MKNATTRYEIARYEVTRWAREPGNKPLYHQARERLAQVGAASENPYTAAKALGLKIG